MKRGKRFGLRLRKTWEGPRLVGVGRGLGHGSLLHPQVRQRRQVAVLKLYLDKKGITHDL